MFHHPSFSLENICDFFKKKSVTSHKDQIWRVASMQLLVNMTNVTQPKVKKLPYHAKIC
jgi:hypothetical protein